MTYLKEISSVKTGNTIIVKGYRTDSDYLFSMEIAQNENGNWVRKYTQFLHPDPMPSIDFYAESILTMFDPVKQEEWDHLFKELLVHPKVRLHTLF